MRVLDLAVYPDCSIGYAWRASLWGKPTYLHFFRFGEEYSLCGCYRISDHLRFAAPMHPASMDTSAQCMATSVIRKGVVLFQPAIGVISIRDDTMRYPCRECAAKADWVRVKLICASRDVGTSCVTTVAKLSEVNFDMLEGCG